MLKRAKNVLAGVVGAFTTFVVFAAPVAAQRYYSDYSYTNYDSGASAGVTLISCVLYCVILLVALAAYVFVSLQLAKIYEKNGITDKKIFAFIPFANMYYLAVAVGEEKDAMLYALAPLFGIIPCIGFFISLYFSAKLWMKVAARMGKSDSVGLFIALGGFLTLIPCIGWVAPFVVLYMIYDLANQTPVSTPVSA